MTVTVSTWTTVRLSREAAMHGQPLSRAVMVACAQNRGPALHILHHTPSISEMTVTLRRALIALENWMYEGSREGLETHHIIRSVFWL